VTDSIAAGVLEACALLAGPADDPDATARRLGEVEAGEAAQQLILVRPADPRWRRIQVQADAAGRLVGLVLELPAGAAVPVDGLRAALGEPDEEWTPGARRPMLVYDEPGGACRILAGVERGVGGELLADRFTVVRR
jgi:hypothetical protein